MRNIWKVSLVVAAVLAAGISVEAQEEKKPAAAEASKPETPGKALTRFFAYEEYEFRSAAEAMPEEKWNYRPAAGMFKDEKPPYGPGEVRTFAEQVKHVACANFMFAAFLDGTKAPEGCDKGGPSPAKTRAELLSYLRDSFAALTKSLGAITEKNMYDQVQEKPMQNNRLGVGILSIWHVGDHYGQIAIYLRENGIVPPASRPNPPELK
jgi:DinB superfamily